MSAIESLKNELCGYIDQHADEMLEISHLIHANPELGLQEYFASGLLCERLAACGFEVKRGLAGLETSFRADYSSGSKGPRIAIFAEYDALAGIGHGCGHNIISACAVGSAAALKEILARTGGSVCVIGSPAEETSGGKINLLDAGILDDCDYAMMAHPCAGEGIVGKGGVACCELVFEYFGKSTHSASEHTGVNALTALISTFNNIAAIRPSFRPGQKLNGIILNGGEASNVIPAYAKSSFCVRANTLPELKELIERVINCAKAAALSVGAEVKYGHGPLFAERYSNHRMDEKYKDNMEKIGIRMHFPGPADMVGSSDIGNVSLKMPTVHEYTSATEETMNIHTSEFAGVCGGKGGDAACINSAKGLAMLACDLLCDEQFRSEVNEEFERIKT